MPTYVNLPSFNLGKDDLTAENVIYEDKEHGIVITVQDMLDYLASAVIAAGAKIYYGTTEYWDLGPPIVSEAGSMYVYSDYYTDDSTVVPAIKVGDGMAYVSSLPFINKEVDDHINNVAVHLSQKDREKLENSVCARIDEVDGENLILHKELL